MSNNATVVPMVQKFNSWIGEEELLSGLIQNKQKLTTFLEEINPEFFNNTNAKTIFRTIRVYFEKYNSPPPKSIMLSQIQKLIATDKISDPKGLIAMTDSVYARKPLEEHELQYFHDEVLRFIKQGKIKDVMFRGINLMDDPDAFEQIQEDLKNAVLWKIDENLGVEIRDIKERYARQKELLDSFVPTPWASLNRVIGGGFFPKTVNLFVAASSVGKSIALDQYAFYSWKDLKKNVLSITLELSEEMKGMRMDSAFTGKMFGELIHSEQEVIDAYSQVDPDGKQLIIKEFPTSTISSRKILHFIERLKMYKGFVPDVVVVDYANILLPNSLKKQSLYEDMGAVIEQLRGISYELSCPVVSALQFNRNAIELPVEDVTEFHIAESQKIMNTADNIVAIVANAAQRSMGQANFKVLKSRMGVKDSIIPMNVKYETFRFYES